MLSWNKFNSAMQFYVLTFPNPAGTELVKSYFHLMKNDFTDQEFEETAILIAKQARFFPLPADFYQHKPKPKVPTLEELRNEWRNKLSGKDYEFKDWLTQVLNYYEGQACNNFREMTEIQWDYMCQAFNKAFNNFCKDYEKGSNIRINYAKIPHITSSSEKKGAISLGQSLKSLTEVKK